MILRVKVIDFNEFIKLKKADYGIDDIDFNNKLVTFLVSNDWFGYTATIKNNTILFDKNEIEILEKKIDIFCINYHKSDKEKTNYLTQELSEFLPKTTKLLQRYIISNGLDDEISLRLVDYLYSFLPGELDESTDSEISMLMDNAFDELQHITATVFADFVNWVHEHTKTVYKNLYYINNYSNNTNGNSAYDMDSYLKILYHLYNQNYIEENDMYYLAANSKNYTDTWLFLSMHFLCALRNTDLLRIPHPKLPVEPEQVIQQISDGTFSESNAKSTIYSVIWELEAFMPTPNKTKNTSGVASIKFHIPESVEVHIGTLFALAESHFRLANKNPNEPLLRIITKYEQINRYMGEEIGELFLESDFRCKAANKSYMQMIYLLTDDILGINDDFKVKGYMLAALARSHKNSYGDFAKTTSIYLKDAKMSGYSPEFVARELFERGVLSTIPSMLLKMIVGDKYTKLSVENQTKLIQSLNMSPIEVEKTVSIMQQNVKRSTEIVKSLYNDHSKQELINILHKIGNGEALSKNDACMCLIIAMGKMCPHLGHSNCASCQYEISTKTTMFLMARELMRLRDLYKKTKNPIEKQRYKKMIKDIVAPSIEEMLCITEEIYGSRTVEGLEKIITEVNNG